MEFDSPGQLHNKLLLHYHYIKTGLPLHYYCFTTALLLHYFYYFQLLPITSDYSQYSVDLKNRNIFKKTLNCLYVITAITTHV